MKHLTKKQVISIKEQYEKRREMGGLSLLRAYGRPSQAKQDAYDECLRILWAYQGECGTIVNYNSQKFSFGFTTKNSEGKEYLVYFTKDYEYWIDINDMKGWKYNR